jgi:DNA replication protein DnaC
MNNKQYLTMDRKRDHESASVVQGGDIKRRKLDDSNSHIGQFTMTLDSSLISYNFVLHFITKLYIDQCKINNDFNELAFSHIDTEDHQNEYIYMIPENREITVKYKEDYVLCKRYRISNDHGTMSDVTYLYGFKMISKSKDVIDKLLLEATTKKQEQMIFCYKSDPGYWKKNGKVQQRPIESLVMDKTVINDLFEDIDLFCTKEAESEYTFFGQQYKRNYLFHGRPGTGKSSLVSIIATKFNRNIYIVCFDPNLTDSLLMTAISTINDKNAILLLEDIDCVFSDRESATSKSSVSYSTLFNILDGVSRVKGMITIVTTNYVDRLDKALIRAGRIDKMIRFDVISKQQLLDILQIYSINLEKTTLDKIYALCKEEDLVPSVLSGFLFRNRKVKLSDSEFINIFNKYLKEINPTFSKNTSNSLYS